MRSDEHLEVLQVCVPAHLKNAIEQRARMDERTVSSMCRVILQREFAQGKDNAPRP